MTIGVHAFEPFAGRMMGMAIGTPQVEVWMTLGRLERRGALKYPPHKGYHVANNPSRKIYLEYKNERLSAIRVYKKDSLGLKYEWLGH
jgi:hypothetical protein